MSRMVMVKGKKFRIPQIVAREGPFILVKRLTQVPKALGIEFVVLRQTDLGDILVSSTFGGAKTKSQGMLRLRLAAKAEKAAIAVGKAAKRAGISLGKSVGRTAKKTGIALGKEFFKRFSKSIRGKASTPRKTKKRKPKKRRK